MTANGIGIPAFAPAPLVRFLVLLLFFLLV